MNRTFASTLGIALSVASLVLCISPDTQQSISSGDRGPEYGIQRQSWELLRLRDPATGRIPDGIRLEELAYAATIPSHDPSVLLAKGVAAYDWVSRGPVNIGGRTRALALDVTGEDTIIAGGVSGGIWRSINGGATWQRMTLPTQLPSVTTIVQDTRPGKTSRWYAGSGELIGNSSSGNGAFFTGDGLSRSTDNGITWTSLTATTSGTPHLFEKVYDFVARIALDPSKTNDVVFAAVYGTIGRSTDGGGSWRTVLGGTDQSNIYSAYTDVAVTTTGIAYATLSDEGFKRGFWRSADGVAWAKISPQDLPQEFRRCVLAITPQNENVVYFLAETPGTGALGMTHRGDSSWQSLWRYTYDSGDGTGAGGRWENLTANIPLFGKPYGDLFTQTGYDMVITVDPFDSNHVVIGGTNLYISTDGYRSTANTNWIGGFHNGLIDSAVVVDYSYPEHHADQHTAVFSRNRRDVLYTGSDGGVHRTINVRADSINWTSLNRAYLTTQFYAVTLDHATPGDQTIVGGMQDNGTWTTRTENAATPWVNVGSGDGSFTALADGGMSLYVSKQLGKTYRIVRDAEGNTVNSGRIDPTGAARYLFINPFTLDPADSRVMYLAAGHELWRNSDLTSIPLGSMQTTSIGWSKLTANVPDTVFITALGASKDAPAHRLYYGTHLGDVYRIDGAASGDPTPTRITSTAFPAGAYVNCIAVDPENADRAVVVFSNYRVKSLFSTTDGGATWSHVSGNLEVVPAGTGGGPSCRWLSILHRGSVTVYLVATSTGLYSTTQLNGTSTRWVLEAASSIGNTVVDMIDVRQADGYVAVGTHGLGVWSAVIPFAGVRDESTTMSAMIESIVPNPVVGRATITINVPASIGNRHARLRLFDARGTEVATLLDDVLSPGRHSIQLSGDVAGRSGRHFCRLDLNDHIETRAIDLLQP